MGGPTGAAGDCGKGLGHGGNDTGGRLFVQVVVGREGLGGTAAVGGCR